MTTNAALRATVREETGKGAARKLRARGRIPAILYGKGMEPCPLAVDAHDTELLLRSISRENTLVALTIEGDGGSRTVQTIVREVQTHPFKPQILHLDFYAVQAGVAVEVEVPIRLVGAPVGVREQGGILEQLLHALPIRCLPARIPPVVEVDVGGLRIGDAVRVSDLRLEEAAVLVDPHRPLCTVLPPKVPPEEEAAPAPKEAVPAEAPGEEAPEPPGRTGPQAGDA